MKKTATVTFLVFFTLLAVNLSFGLPRLAHYSAVDEHFWTYDRIPQFWNAVSRHKWKSTKINDKPGITVALVSGGGLLFSNPLEYKKILDNPKSPSIAQGIEKATFDLRLPLYIFILLMSPVFYFLLKRLLGRTIALFSIIFIYLSPIILGISLFINPDSLLWIFVSLSLVSFLVFLRTEALRFASLAGMFLGLALLTKYVATILFLFLPLLVLLDRLFHKKNMAEKERLKKTFSGFLLAILLSLVVISLLYPAVWNDFGLLWGTSFLTPPMEKLLPFWILAMVILSVDIFLLGSRGMKLLLGFLDKYKMIIAKAIIAVLILGILAAALNTFSHMHFYDFENALLSPKGGDHSHFSLSDTFLATLTGIYVLIFTLTPTALIFFFLAAWKIIRAQKINFENNLFPILAILFFILVYYLGSAVNFIEATVRYQISLYPLAGIVAAVGLAEFLRMEKIQSLKKYLSIATVSVILMFISGLSLFLIRPYYFAYSSDLLPKEYIANPKSMGDGMFQAADFLNNLATPQKLSVWTDKVGLCKDFAGHCYTSLKDKNLPARGIDYFVLSEGNAGKSIAFSTSRNLVSPGFSEMKIFYYSDRFDVMKIEIDNRSDNFVKIIKNPDL